MISKSANDCHQDETSGAGECDAKRSFLAHFPRAPSRALPPSAGALSCGHCLPPALPPQSMQQFDAPRPLTRCFLASLIMFKEGMFIINGCGDRTPL